MRSKLRAPFVAQALGCWNWKCALFSATARSLVYLIAMARGGAHDRLGIVLVEVAYVTLTAGLYAGMQQQALAVRPRVLGNLIVVVGVPGLAQLMDWLVHRIAGALVPQRAMVSVCLFAGISALFHLHVMRCGALLTGSNGRSLADDIRRMPMLVAGFVSKPFVALPDLAARVARRLGSEAAA